MTRRRERRPVAQPTIITINNSAGTTTTTHRRKLVGKQRWKIGQTWSKMCVRTRAAVFMCSFPAITPRGARGIALPLMDAALTWCTSTGWRDHGAVKTHKCTLKYTQQTGLEQLSTYTQHAVHFLWRGSGICGFASCHLFSINHLFCLSQSSLVPVLIVFSLKFFWIASHSICTSCGVWPILNSTQHD